VGGLGDWVGRVLIGMGALLLAAVVGIGAIAVAVLFVNAVS
jgi:carbonic anhydrase/acetyltransferase-like protein (isoleucine patch superfamily)